MITYFNWILFFLDLAIIIGLLILYFWSLKIYRNWSSLEINSSNSNINNATLENFAKTFSKYLKLEHFDINLVSDENYFRIFSNWDKKRQTIIISKKFFLSVGYELDYISSRIWLSCETKSKNPQVFWYRFLVKYLSPFFLFLIFISFFIQFTIFLVVGIKAGNNTSYIVDFLWRVPIFGLLVIFSALAMALNYYFLVQIKKSIELEYNKVIIRFVKKYFPIYFYDIQAARKYDQTVHYPYLWLVGKQHDKWLGAFVYY